MRTRLTLPALLILACLAFACESFEYRDAKGEDTIAAYRAHLAKYPDSIHRDNIEDRIEYLELKKALAADSVQALDEFKKKYPETRYEEQLAERFDYYAYVKAREADSLESYRAYLDEYPEGYSAHLARGRIEDLRFLEALGSSDPALAEKFIEDFPAHNGLMKLRAHLMDLWEKEYGSAGRERKKYIEDRSRELTRTFSTEVDQETWIEDGATAGAYEKDLAEIMTEAGFVPADSDEKEAAEEDGGPARTRRPGDLVVRLELKETRGSPYYGAAGKEIGRATDFKGAIRVTRRVTGERLVDERLRYRQPFNIEVPVPERGEDMQALIYRAALEEFRKEPFYARLGLIARMRLGDEVVCPWFHQLLLSPRPDDRDMAAAELKKSGCSPEAGEEKAALAIHEGDKDTCLALGDTCARAIYAFTMGREDFEKRPPKSFGWLDEMGAEGASYLCRVLAASVASGEVMDLDDVTEALAEADGERAKKCLSAQINAPLPDYLKDLGMVEERKKYLERVEFLKRALAELEAE